MLNEIKVLILIILEVLYETRLLLDRPDFENVLILIILEVLYEAEKLVWNKQHPKS